MSAISFALLKELELKNRGGAPSGSAVVNVVMANIPVALNVFEIITGMEWFLSNGKLHGGHPAKVQLIDITRNKADRTFIGQFVWRRSELQQGAPMPPPKNLVPAVIEAVNRRLLWLLTEHYEEQGRRTVGAVLFGATSADILRDKLPANVKDVVASSSLQHQPKDATVCIVEPPIGSVASTASSNDSAYGIGGSGSSISSGLIGKPPVKPYQATGDLFVDQNAQQQPLPQQQRSVPQTPFFVDPTTQPVSMFAQAGMASSLRKSEPTSKPFAPPLDFGSWQQQPQPATRIGLPAPANAGQQPAARQSRWDWGSST